MKTNAQSGLSTLHIIIILTGIAVIFGLIATLNDDNDVESATQNSADVTEGDTPLENLAQNIAKNKAGSVTDAAAKRNSQLQAGMDNNGTTQAAPAPIVAGSFDTYSSDKLALANDGTVVLFFRADWCPSCRGLEEDITKNLSQIPDNTHILTLDYDTETELKKQYGVIRQHTLVVVDANGTEVKKLTGLTNTLDQVVSQL